MKRHRHISEVTETTKIGIVSAKMTEIANNNKKVNISNGGG